MGFHPTSNHESSAPGWGLLGLLIAGLALAVGGIQRQHPMLGLTGLALAGLGGLGLWHRLVTVQRELLDRQALFQELNQNLDEQVQARTLRLMQTIEDLESFNRMVTHDLRSPLSGLLVGLEILTEKMGQRTEQELGPLMEELGRSATRMKDLIEDLYQLALISGRIAAIQAVDISHYSELVLKHLHQKELHRKVQWHIEQGLSVYGDPNLIRIALENLLSNAWKYTLECGLAEIQVRRGEGPGMVIEIRDNGSGFDMTKADKLFEPFFRLHTDPKYPGHGIGLSIVKRIMTKHGGKATAMSSPGRGTTFRLEFPEGEGEDVPLSSET